MNTHHPLVLYRATVLDIESRVDPEFFVFFEAPRQNRNAVLESLLCNAWAVDVSTLAMMAFSEVDLYDLAMGPAADGDVRLFEDGHDAERIFYLDPARTQFFVRPETQARLQAAQAVAVQRRGAA